jgi:drug/metabolite transporter (DMT)-like permease
MFASAWLANSFTGIVFALRDGAGEEQRLQLGWTAVGALSGAAAELWVRGWRPSGRIGIWGLLQLTALVAIAIALLVLIRDA